MSTLNALWKEMSDHTVQRCGPPHCRCLSPTRCCDRFYCDMAKEYAEEKGVELKPTGHPTLPFMGETGCVVPPELRPLCTLHQCSINSIGSLKGDPKWTKRYFEIREQIDLKMEELTACPDRSEV